jgi:alpha-tubulin suppressor-like RCC1 family protein
LTPGAVAGNRRFSQIRAGVVHTCAVTAAHVAFCWGENADGRLGDGTTFRRLVPSRVIGNHEWRQLSPGGGQTCGVTTDDVAYCWGLNGNGELGNGGQGDIRLSPSAVSGGLRFRQVEAGYNHTCGVTTEDRGFCWGYGGAGNLGDGTQTLAQLVPAPVAGTRRFRHLNAGLSHTCGMKLSGSGFCWGGNGSGQIGDGTTVMRTLPRALAVDLELDQISAGGFHTCGVTVGGKTYCWGNNIRGQIGDGTADPSGAAHPLPVLIAAP